LARHSLHRAFLSPTSSKWLQAADWPTAICPVVVLW